MGLDLQTIAEYERIITKCMQPLADANPGMEIVARDDLTIISSLQYPSPDANQAFLLRATEAMADSLIEEVIRYFNDRGLPPTIFISPACTPADLSQRLLRRGFVRQGPDESWIVFEHLQAARVPETDPKIQVREARGNEILLFAKTMAAAYDMPAESTPMLTETLELTNGQPNFRNYLAYIDHQPAATFTVMRHETFAIIGAGGVLPKYRGGTVLFNLAVNAIARARQEGVDTVIGQTTLGPVFERFLRICGFKQAFRRTGYTLE